MNVHYLAIPISQISQSSTVNFTELERFILADSPIPSTPSSFRSFPDPLYALNIGPLTVFRSSLEGCLLFSLTKDLDQAYISRLTFLRSVRSRSLNTSASASGFSMASTAFSVYLARIVSVGGNSKSLIGSLIDTSFLICANGVWVIGATAIILPLLERTPIPPGLAAGEEELESCSASEIVLAREDVPLKLLLADLRGLLLEGLSPPG
mmetsp:Transcript_20796/g.46627  ORF Transcript_20796/g.46627 Transcript_20796/m.46627 type:complete len:209 (+) Transcript_20796:64-690(+)